MPYDMSTHRRNFAIWAAARAAQRGFTSVDNLRDAILVAGVVEYVENSAEEEIDAGSFDAMHKTWCNRIVDYLSEMGVPNTTFGRAAKAVAVFLKSSVVLGPHGDKTLASVAHPPIDRILLQNLARSKLGTAAQRRAWQKMAWTTFTEQDYYPLVVDLRGLVPPEQPFWKLEEHWTVTNEQ